MLFNSLDFGIFFLFVFICYWRLPHRWQNRFLLAASYVFYGAWDWRFCFLMAFSTVVDYFLALKIQDCVDPVWKKRFIFLSVTVSLALLGFFKYYHFFVDGFVDLMRVFGLSLNPHVWRIILPVGISFYTFQTMSYTIDVYRGHLAPARNFRDVAVYVSFFPQLVAGPIERASHLLPQVLNRRIFQWDQFYQGCYLIFWGLFQKVYIADNLAQIADPVFDAAGPAEGPMILAAVYAFAVQIFCDFDGYSNIARGAAKCLGFDLMVNFHLPYFAVNPREFWQRWHISLSSWLRDYLYIPLGGNRYGPGKTYRNLILTMVLGGLWHGAAWTFVLWGTYHGLLLAVHRLIVSLRSHLSTVAPATPLTQILRLLKGVFFFHLVCLGWLIFRAQSLNQLGVMLDGLVFHWPADALGVLGQELMRIVPYLWILGLVQVLQWKSQDLLIMLRMHFLIRTAFYYICAILLIIFGATGAQEFIYFQF
jgi:D-alanyl-lipoteichoic acid acyltransferase DltB (MBOAT superfamily)